MREKKLGPPSSSALHFVTVLLLAPSLRREDHEVLRNGRGDAFALTTRATAAAALDEETKGRREAQRRTRRVCGKIDL